MAGAPQRGGFKRASTVKRSAPDSRSGPAKKAKQSDSADEHSESEGPVVPAVRTDDEGNAYVAINRSGKRRVTISAFKKTTYVHVREYYAAEGGALRPGKKGISLTVEQYNALLAAAPLLERELKKSGEAIIRPVYDGDAGVDDAEGEEKNEGAGEGEGEQEGEDEGDE